MTSYVVNIEILGAIIPLCASVRDRSIYASNVGIQRTRSSMGVALKEHLAVALVFCRDHAEQIQARGLYSLLIATTTAADIIAATVPFPQLLYSCISEL